MQINNARRSISAFARVIQQKHRAIIRKDQQFVGIRRKDEYLNVQGILNRILFFGLESGFLKKFQNGNFSIHSENLVTQGQNTPKKREVRV